MKIIFYTCTILFVSTYGVDSELQKDILKKKRVADWKTEQAKYISEQINNGINQLSGTTVEQQKEIIRKIMLSSDVQEVMASSNTEEIYAQVQQLLPEEKKYLFHNAILAEYNAHDPYTLRTIILCQALMSTQHIKGTLLTPEVADSIRNFEVRISPHEVQKFGIILDADKKNDPDFYNKWREKALLRSIEIQSLALSSRQPVSSKPWYQFW